MVSRTFIRLNILILALSMIGCGTDEDEEEIKTESDPPPTYCDVPATLERTTNTDRAGEVNFCSAAWVEVTDNVPCVSPAVCETENRQCMKEAGKLSEQCLLPCGGGKICPEGMHCRDCEDSEPYCADTNTCPKPHLRRYDANGAECQQGQSVVIAPAPADVTALCEEYNFNSRCDVSCWQSEQCCDSQQGQEMACISDQRHYDALEKHELIQKCVVTCDSVSDCGSEGGQKYCCMPLDSDDDGRYKTSLLLGTASSSRICWYRGIHDFCPDISGGGGGGGSNACQQCRNTCSGQGSWCQCDDECN